MEVSYLISGKKIETFDVLKFSAYLGDLCLWWKPVSSVYSVFKNPNSYFKDNLLYTHTIDLNLWNLWEYIPVHHKTGGGDWKGLESSIIVCIYKICYHCPSGWLLRAQISWKTLEAFEAHQDGLITFSDYFEEKNGSKIDARIQI